jgi:type II secretory pathway component GspD/PulD (secretin)/tetratricopeptide (TPR) repeat protein
MIRFLLSGTLVVMVATTAALVAHAAAPQSAEEEAVRRQSAILETRFALERAQAVARQGDRAKAAKAYEEAYNAAMAVSGKGVENELKQIIAGLASAKLDLAREAYKQGDVTTALDHVNRVLRVDPSNPAAVSLKQTYDKTAESLKGRLPSAETQKQIPVEMDRRTQAGTLVQDGKLLFELGNLDEAEKKLKAAAALDPYNEGAFYYLDLIKNRRYTEEARRREIYAKDAIVEVERAWNPPVKRELLPTPNPMAKTNLVHTGPGRTQIYRMLNEIRLPEVLFDGLPLGEVVKFLDDEVRKLDPAKQGINFMMNSGADAGGGQPPVTVDPTTGAIIPAPPVESVDLNLVTVRINPALRNVRLADVLDAITKVSDRPIKYSIEEYAIVFSPKRAEAAQLFTRTWKVDPNTFRQGLESVTGITFGDLQTGTGDGGGAGGRGGGGRGGGGRGGGDNEGGVLDAFIIPRVQVARPQQGGFGQGGFGGGGGPAADPSQPGQPGQANGISFVTRVVDTSTVQDLARQFFIAAGVNLAPPANLFWNDRTGVLMVRATLQDLDLVEQAIAVLNQAPPQVMIEAKFAEITQNDAKALGFDWFLGPSGSRVVSQAGSQPSLNGVPNNLNPFGTFPGAPQTPNFLLPSGALVPGAASTLIPQQSTDGLLTSGLRNSALPDGGTIPQVATITGILTDPQFRLVIRALEQRTGVDLLSAPRVTTVSGRQTQIATVDIVTVVTGVDLNQQAGGGAGQQQVVTPGAFAGGVIGTTIQPNTQPLPFGPVLDVIPYVSADGYTIQMTIIPTLTQFLGYDDPGPFVPTAQGAAGNTVGTPITAVLPLPRLRARQLVTTATVWDGQTVMLGGLLAEDVTKIKDKVPVLGDLPWVGRLFRTESRNSAKKNLVIFVTPTIIDPAGNRVHNDADLPFAKVGIPPQPPATQ